MDADRRLQQKSDRKEKRVVERVEFVTAETPCGVAPHGACNESATQRGVVAGAFVLLTEVVSAAHDTVPEKGVFGSCGQTGDSSPELVAQIEGDAEHMVRAERQVKRASERAACRQAVALSVGGFHIGADVGQPQSDDPTGALHGTERSAVGRTDVERDALHRFLPESLIGTDVTDRQRKR